MGVISHPSFPPSAAALIAARLLNRHSTSEIGHAIEILMDVLDLMDGDADVELNGDERDGQPSEDEFMLHGTHGPGCPLSDPDTCVTDAPHDKAEEGDFEPERSNELPIPRYGIDQSTGPINVIAALRENRTDN